MKPYKSLPSAEAIRAAFDYSPETGVLIWKPRAGTSREDNIFNALFAGKPTGCENGLGYLRVLWNRQHYVAHRIVWKWWYGVDAMMIDHINGNRSDNRIANLRECERSGNNANSRTRASNKAKLKGAYPNGNGWQASIRKNGVGTYLGTFPTPEEAHAAYCEAAKRLHGKFFKPD